MPARGVASASIHPWARLIPTAAAVRSSRRPSSRSAVRRAVGPEIDERGVNGTSLVPDRHRGRGKALLPLSERHRPLGQADLLELGDELIRGGGAWGQRLPSHAAELLGLRRRVREGEQELARRADREGQRLADSGEVAELVVALDRRDADAAVPLPDVEVDALADDVAEAHHRTFRDAGDVAVPAGRIAPAGQARAGRVVRGPDPEQQPELHQLRQQAVDRRPWLTEAMGDVGHRGRLRSFRDHVEDLGRLLQHRHQSTGVP